MKQCIVSHRFGSRGYWWLCKCVLNHRKSAVRLLFNQFQIRTSTALYGRMLCSSPQCKHRSRVIWDTAAPFPYRTDVLLSDMQKTPSLVLDMISKVDFHIVCECDGISTSILNNMLLSWLLSPQTLQQLPRCVLLSSLLYILMSSSCC